MPRSVPAVTLAEWLAWTNALASPSRAKVSAQKVRAKNPRASACFVEVDHHRVLEARSRELHRLLLYARRDSGHAGTAYAPRGIEKRKGMTMILVDGALERHVAEGRPPIRVGMIGAGFMAAGVLLQINSALPRAMRVVAVANRTPARAVQAYADAGQEDAAVVDGAPALARAIEAGRAAVTEDPMLVATSPHVDVLLEVTGAVEDALPVVLAAIAHGKHVV
jgi:hypothetical protein